MIPTGGGGEVYLHLPLRGAPREAAGVALPSGIPRWVSSERAISAFLRRSWEKKTKNSVGLCVCVCVYCLADGLRVCVCVCRMLGHQEGKVFGVVARNLEVMRCL